ncbi:helix-turn-helix domain-containing protein [Ruminococcaceae bacterium OttesenSCG-928-D13]|nr:helix-turn-helix domain-containing protein [Ruminococcaceae bacterium OttesenSCG-928-D13]
MAVFRVAKTRDYTVMSNHHLKDHRLTLKSKGLLSIMLSLPDEWNYTTRGLAGICREGVDCIGSCLKELERTGYMVRNRLRDKKGKITDVEYTIFEEPQPAPKPGGFLQKPHTGNPDMDNPDMEKPDMALPDMGHPDPENPALLNTYRSNTDKSIKHPSIHPAPKAKPPPSSRDGPDEMDGVEVYRNLIMENIEYNLLVRRHSAERVDEVMELLLEVLGTKRPTVRIANDDKATNTVKSRLLKLDSSHVEYVFDCLDSNTTKIRNIKAYLLTALYNAPATMDSYYRAEVNHDLYGSDP